MSDATTAIITNRGTGYRWILRRGEHRLEFQTPEIFENEVNQEPIDVQLTIEEAEALATAAASATVTDKRVQVLAGQALDQIGMLCRQVRERVRLGDTFIDSWTRSLPRKPPEPQAESQAISQESTPVPRHKYRPLGDPDNLTLAEAGELLGKARNTLWLWYKKGELPPAVDVSTYLSYHPNDKPVIVVPRYRLNAWQAGERMPEIFQAVFESYSLHEPPWTCYRARKGTSRKDIEFWIERRGLIKAVAKDGRRLYGEGLEQDKVYTPRLPL